MSRWHRSLTLLFSLKLMIIYTVEDIDSEIGIVGRNITNLRLADDIDALAEEEQEQKAQVESLNKTCTRYEMEIRAEKTKLMTTSAGGIQRKIKVKMRSWVL